MKAPKLLQDHLRKIFVNPGQCPCQPVKTENDITSSKIDIVEQNLNMKCISTLPTDLCQKIKNLRKFPIFPDFQTFPEYKVTFCEILEKNCRSGHTILNKDYNSKNEALSIFLL